MNQSRNTKGKRDRGTHFLFVLICPICPQFAHRLPVPSGFAFLRPFFGATAPASPPSSPPSAVGELMADGEATRPFARRRASLRSRLRCRRAISSAALWEVMGQWLFVCVCVDGW